METIYDVMKDRLQVTETTLMVTILSGPRQGDKTVYAEDGSVLYGTPIEGFTVDKAKLNSLCMVGEIECFVQPVENDPSVLVLGAGHVSRAITDLLLFIGCRVTVVDDRPEYVVPEFFEDVYKRQRVGDVEAELAKCDYVVDGTYFDQATRQTAMEPFQSFGYVDALGRVRCV